MGTSPVRHIFLTIRGNFHTLGLMRIDHFPYKDARKYPETIPVPPEVAAFLKGAPCKAETVKERAKRSVFVIYADKDPTCPAYFVKYDHPSRWLDKLKGPIRPKVKKEYQITRRLFDLKVPVVEPVFCAWTPFQGIFVSKAAPGVSCREQWLRIQGDPTLRQLFLEHWRGLLIKVLQNNLYHPDFHFGNIITVKNGRLFHPLLVDVVDVKICRRLSERQILQNLRSLADLYQELRNEERTFMVSGLPGSLGHVPPPEIWGKIRQHTVRVFYQKGWRHLRERVFDKESLVHITNDNEGAYRIRKDTISLFAAKAVIAAYKFGQGGDTRQVHGKESRPGPTAAKVNNNNTAYIVQEYDKIMPFFLSSPDITGWFKRWGMHAAGFAVPRPLALIREKNGARYIVSDHVAGDPLPEALTRADARADGSLEALFQALYDYVRRLYVWRIVDHRLRPADFVVTPGQRLFLLSSDNLIFNRRISQRHWAKVKRRLIRDMPEAVTEAFRQWLDTRDNPVDH